MPQTVFGIPLRMSGIVDIKDNILQRSEPVGTVAIAKQDDTYTLMVSRGDGRWLESEFRFFLAPNTPDIGAFQDSPHLGYGADYVVGKLLARVDIGNAADTTNASANRMPIRANGGYLQVYANGTWNNVVMGFTFNERSDKQYRLTYLPVGKLWQYDTDGNSVDQTDANGYPVVMSWQSDIGAYQSPLVVGRRTI